MNKKKLFFTILELIFIIGLAFTLYYYWQQTNKTQARREEINGVYRYFNMSHKCLMEKIEDGRINQTDKCGCLYKQEDYIQNHPDNKILQGYMNEIERFKPECNNTENGN